MTEIPLATKTTREALTQWQLLLMRNDYADAVDAHFKKKPRLCSRG